MEMIYADDDANGSPLGVSVLTLHRRFLSYICKKDIGPVGY
jgi:hypothetical protein